MELKVLIAEDEGYCSRVLASIIRLNRPKYNVDIVDNGKKALEYINDTDIDVLITDIQMPMVDGIQLMEKVNMSNSDVQVIVLSGYDNFEYAQKAVKYGAKGYILKPINPDTIIETLERVEEEIRFRRQSEKANVKLKELCYEYFDEHPLKVKEVIENGELNDILDKLNENYVSTDNNTIERVIDYIMDNYNRDISLDSISKQFHFNQSYLSVLFKKHTNKNFKDYLKGLRVDKAKKMLRLTNKKIYEIADEVGYRDYQYFCKLFKKITGVTPTKYRRLKS